MNRGFTLTEILLVNVIIGIFAALNIPIYLHWIEKVEKIKVVLTLDTLAKAILNDGLEHRKYPPDLYPGQSLPHINEWPTDATHYDYEHWGLGDGSCSVLITHYGQDGVRQSPIHKNYGKAGSISQEYGDDILKVVDVYKCTKPGGSVM